MAKRKKPKKMASGFVISKYTGFFLFDVVGGVGVVPFPGFAVVIRKSLTPDGLVGICLVPSEYDNDGSSYLVIFGEEEADAVVKGTDLRRVDRAALAVHPV